jgi:hypothetical protein
MQIRRELPSIYKGRRSDARRDFAAVNGIPGRATGIPNQMEVRSTMRRKTRDGIDAVKHNESK